MNIEHLKFPIGQYEVPEFISEDHIKKWIIEFEEFPYQLEKAITGLTKEQLDWKYRPNGWTIKQVVHHCADSHMNSLIRFKLALTEESPTIRPYKEDLWANLLDSQDFSLDHSIQILKGVHGKLTVLFNALSVKELNKTFIHPEHNQTFSIQYNIGNYAWHSKHHLAHVLQAIEACGQYN